jgi:NAD(P)-dependent dehydrogenase (short-subunit alcohol dehydrogenase family)
MQNTAHYPSLSGQGIFITGGATGIGAAMVRAFCAQGARVAFADLNTTAATELVQELENLPQFFHVDVTDTDALQQAIRQAHDLTAINVLVNNAANDMRHSPNDMSPQAWRDCMAINLDAAFFAAQASAPLMAAQGGGSIINFSSINALLGPQQMPGYVSAKAGLIGMTKALARDYGPDLVRVNAILPGWVGHRASTANMVNPRRRDPVDAAGGATETPDARRRRATGIIFRRPRQRHDYRPELYH